MPEHIVSDDLAALLELFASGAWASREGVIVACNGHLRDLATEMRGWTDPRGHPFWELFEQEEMESLRLGHASWHASGTFRTTIGPGLTGNRGAMEGPVVHLFHLEGHEIGVLMTMGASSPREHLEMLEAHFQVFRAYLREGNIGLIVFEESEPGRAIIRHISDEACWILEVRPSDTTGRDLLDIVHIPELPRATEFYEQWRAGDTDVGYIEVQVVTASGETLTVEAVPGSVVWRGRPAGFVVFRDVTDRAIILNELRRYAQAFELLDESVVLADGDFDIIYMNPAGLQRSGYTLDEVVGRPFMNFAADRDEDVRGAMLAQLHRDGIWKGEQMAQRRDGTRYPIELSITLHRDDEGTPQMVTLLGHDISMQKAIDGSLRRARERAEFFTDLMSHDINNYIQGVLGRLQLLEASDLTDVQATNVDRAIAQAQNTSQLVARVRSLSQTQHGGALFPVDLRKVLSDVTADLRLKWKDRTFTVHVAHQVDVVNVLADDLLKDLVINILDNAIKHSPSASTIEVMTEPVREGDRRMWRLVVSDHGPGVPDDEKKEVFYRFVRKGSVDGSGLGLSLVMALAERYNGRVWLEDRVPGDHTKGVKVLVELPAA